MQSTTFNQNLTRQKIDGAMPTIDLAYLTLFETNIVGKRKPRVA